MPSPLRLVIFDMDDVLCAYDRPRRLEALARLSGRSADEIDAAIWRSGFEDEADRGMIDAETYLAGFGARIGYPLSREDWIAARRVSMTPFPDMLGLVRALKGSVRVAVLTNNGHLTGQSIDALFPELRPLFGGDIMVSAEFGTAKPDPEVFRRALARCGVKPQEAFFTDDKPENVAGARKAGLAAHLFTGRERLRAALRQSGARLA